MKVFWHFSGRGGTVVTLYPQNINFNTTVNNVTSNKKQNSETRDLKTMLGRNWFQSSTGMIGHDEKSQYDGGPGSITKNTLSHEHHQKPPQKNSQRGWKTTGVNNYANYDYFTGQARG